MNIEELIFISFSLLVFLGFILYMYWRIFNPDKNETSVIKIKYKDFDIIHKSCGSGKLYYSPTGISYKDNNEKIYHLKFNLIDTFRAKRLCKRIIKNRKNQKNNNNYQIMVNETIEHLNKLKEENSNGL